MADLCASRVSRCRLVSLYGCVPSQAASRRRSLRGAGARQAARASASAFDGTSEAMVNIDRSIHLPHNLFSLTVSP